MRIKAHLLFPFDMGLELDFAGKETQQIFKEISSHAVPHLSFEKQAISSASLAIQVYKFGVGLIQISFDVEGSLADAAQLSCFAEKIHVGRAQIVNYCQSLVDDAIQHVQKYASYRYEKRLTEADVYPAFVLDEFLTQEGITDANEAIRRHQKELYGIVAGEPQYEKLSEFALERGKLKNYGYYADEVIMVERFGAVVHSNEAPTVLELIKLAYSQYWNLRAYNFILDGELDDAQVMLDRLPPYYKFWQIPRQYQRFSREAMDFGQDKLAIVESLYALTGNLPRIDADWHLRTIQSSIRHVFTIEDLYKTVNVKLGRIEEAYNSAREFLSTNFFILLDIIFFLSLAWSVIDTVLLWNLSHR
jgi:hypothetical protein